jgi:hypothetical protein
MTPTLIFVYNADSGLFNTLADAAHKIFSPKTYKCNLCALTHTHLGMRREWKAFVESLRRPVEFLHADEAKACYGIEGLPLPLILTKDDRGVKTLVGASSINDCRSIEDLKHLITERLSTPT